MVQSLIVGYFIFFLGLRNRMISQAEGERAMTAVRYRRVRGICPVSQARKEREGSLGAVLAISIFQVTQTLFPEQNLFRENCKKYQFSWA